MGVEGPRMAANALQRAGKDREGLSGTSKGSQMTAKDREGR